MSTSAFTGVRKRPGDFVANLKKDMVVFERFVVVTSPEVKVGRKGRFLIFSIGDATGIVPAYLWDVPENVIGAVTNFFEVGRVYVLNGRVGEYNGIRKLDIRYAEFQEHCFRCEPTDYDERDLNTVPHVPNVEVLLTEICETIPTFSNQTLHDLCQAFFADEDFVTRYRLNVGGIRRHHARVGGLVQHTHSMLCLAKQLCELHPQLDRELLLAGVILHDIGKLYDYEVNLTIRMARDHNYELVGHMVMAQQLIIERIHQSQLQIDQGVLKRLLHLIFSHHGDLLLAQGSAVSPYLPEAIALCHIDALDARVDSAVNNDQLSVIS
jgi:3'-5' exoribonuclease